MQIFSFKAIDIIQLSQEAEPIPVAEIWKHSTEWRSYLTGCLQRGLSHFTSLPQSFCTGHSCTVGGDVNGKLAHWFGSLAGRLENGYIDVKVLFTLTTPNLVPLVMLGVENIRESGDPFFHLSMDHLWIATALARSR